MVDNFLGATNRKAVRLIVVVAGIAIAAVEVQVVTVSRAVLRTTPIVAVAALVVQRSGVIAVAAGG